MRRVITIQQGTHPDTPPAGDVETIQRRLWALYIDGQVFLRTPDRDDARHAQKVALDSGRYEYVDLVLQEDQRDGEDRREYPDEPWIHSAGEQHYRRQTATDRRQS